MLTRSTNGSRAPGATFLPLLALALLPLSACSRRGQPTPAAPATGAALALTDAGIDVDPATSDAGASAGVSDAGTTSNAGAPAGRSADSLRALDAKLRALTSGEPRDLVRGGANEDLSPEARFEIDLPRLADFRVRLLDESDRVVASSDRAELGERLRYQLAPSEPLAPGSRFALVVDGLKSDLPSDDQGRPYELLRIELKTSGEKPKPASKHAKPGKPHKRDR